MFVTCRKGNVDTFKQPLSNRSQDAPRDIVLVGREAGKPLVLIEGEGEPRLLSHVPASHETEIWFHIRTLHSELGLEIGFLSRGVVESQVIHGTKAGVFRVWDILIQDIARSTARIHGQLRSKLVGEHEHRIKVSAPLGDPPLEVLQILASTQDEAEIGLGRHHVVCKQTGSRCKAVAVRLSRFTGSYLRIGSVRVCRGNRATCAEFFADDVSYG